MINTLSGGFFILTGLYSGGLIEREFLAGGEGEGGWKGLMVDGLRLDPYR